MPKRKHLIISDSEGSDDENLEEGILSLVAPPKKFKPVEVPSASKTQSSSGSDTSESDDEWTLGSKHKAKKKLKQGSLKSRKLTGKSGATMGFSSGDEDDSGDSDGSDMGGVAESDNMESDGSDPDSPVTFDDGLDENLIGDAEDRIRLSQMNEAEREAEMYDRFMKREAMKTRFEIQQELKKKARKREEKSKVGKRLRDKDKQKKTDRAKAIEELQAKRLSDKKKKETRQSEPEYDIDEIFECESEEGDKGEQEEKGQFDWDENADEEEESSATQYISTIEQLNRMKISRFRLERLVHMPFFKETVTGAFVRIGIGNHDGRPVYRVAEVIDVIETPKVYTLGKGRTNKGLKLRHGRQERVFRMEYVSNSSFTDSEFRKWKSELEKYDIPLPTEEDMKQKVKDFQEAKNFEFTDEHIDHIISEKAKFRRNPVNYAMTKNRLMMEKDHAEQSGEKQKVESLKKELEELEERAEELDKQRSRGLSAISFINERNRQRNVVLGEAALKEEVAMREKRDDPFTRRKCMPTLVALAGGLVTTGDETKEEVDTGQTEESKPPEVKMQVEKAAQEELLPNDESPKKVLDVLQTPKTLNPVLTGAQSVAETTDLFSAHDFDIQIELPSTASANVVIRTNPRTQLKTSSEGQQRRSLNLNDYKKRRGLI